MEIQFDEHIFQLGGSSIVDPMDSGKYLGKYLYFPLGCPRKLGSMVRINGLFHLLINGV